MSSNVLKSSEYYIKNIDRHEMVFIADKVSTETWK